MNHLIGMFNIILLSFLLIPQTWAQSTSEYPILNVTDDDDQGAGTFSLILDEEGAITSFKFTKGESEDTLTNLEDMDSDEGMLMYSRGGVDVVWLKSSDLDTATGGNISIRYLYDVSANWGNGEYREFNMCLTKIPGHIIEVETEDGVEEQWVEDKWELKHVGRELHGIHFAFYEYWGQIIGIRQIRPLFNKAQR